MRPQVTGFFDDATNTITYPSQPTPARGTATVAPLRPGPLAAVVP